MVNIEKYMPKCICSHCFRKMRFITLHRHMTGHGKSSVKKRRQVLANDIFDASLLSENVLYFFILQCIE